ncbi:lipopolysaccharide biosynthesis protein [Geodermatophilus nigrescens]
MAGSTGRRGALALLGGIVLAGLLVNVYLAVVARALPATADYGEFGAFWSIALVVGFGAFLPLEQEAARLLQTGVDRRATVRAAAAAAGGLAVLAALAVVALLPVLRDAYGGSGGLVLATLATVAVSAVQFLVRGLLIGAGRLDVHGVVLAVDAALRVVLVLVLVLTGSGDGPAWYAWTLVGAILLAHAPVLPWAVRRVVAGGEDAGSTAPSPRALAAALAHLLLASVCAQALLNGPPLLVAAVASAGEGDTAGRFVAAFTLARIPLFVAVPAQSAVVPALTRLVESGRRRELVRLVARASAALVGLAVVGGVLAATVGPTLVGWVFGARYVVVGTDLALMVVGVVAHLGLLLVAQAFVAAARHARVALVWLTAVVAAAVPAVLVSDLTARGALAFLTGSAVGWGLGTLLLITGRSPVPPHPEETR